MLRFVFALVALPLIVLPAAPRQPSLVFFIADDLGGEETFPSGSRVVRTSHLQRRADEGMRFDHFCLTARSCSPSRSRPPARFPAGR
jgi:arylsulfatase A-like enzyme